ncbi:MAG: 50S ribosomal protein L3 [Spirochaetia bacterium]|nr:50S ribosomal protein L3 [Spirochaetia bacterium]
MAKGILARKIGMTQTFDDKGRIIPVTVLEAGPCRVTAVRTTEKDKYQAVQLAFSPVREKVLTKAEIGHFKTNGLLPHRHLKEFRDAGMAVEVGQEVKADIFAPGEIVKIIGIRKGKGFQGGTKRHGFHGGPATHGSKFHREPGSQSAHSFPSRVFKGKRAPGHMGASRVTAVQLKIFRIDVETNLIFVNGPVPGPRQGIVAIEAMIQ